VTPQSPSELERLTAEDAAIDRKLIICAAAEMIMMMTMNTGAFAGSKPLRMEAAKERELALVRPLGYASEFFYLYSLAFPVHFCLAAQIEGALDSARLGGGARGRFATDIRR